MRVHAEAMPLDGPLPGGSEGASVVVEPMQAGAVQLPRPFFERDPGRFASLKMLGVGVPRSEYLLVPIVSYLVRHPSAGLILVDTGLHPSVATDPKENMGRILARFTAMHLVQGEDVPTRLRAKGIDPRSIETVVLTHLHYDHASAISEFPNATFVLSIDEWEAATTDPRPLLRGYRPSHYDFLFDYRTVDFDGPRIDSYGPFARTFDLFGDGSVRLAYTPGNSYGHQSVVLRLPRRDFVVAGDAVYTYRQLEGGPDQPHSADPHNWSRSRQELQLFHREYPYAVIVPGHDPDFFHNLDGRYEQ
jgi:N-acyl homoserine lactone hydrolase